MASTSKSSTTSKSATAPKTAYALFLHREEIQRRKLHWVNVSKTKIQLTRELIAKAQQRVAISYDDLQTMAREHQFKRLLEKKLKEHATQRATQRAAQRKELAKKKHKVKRLQ